MSIIAIFLALAAGIVVGTTALNGQVLDDLRRSVRGLDADKRALETDVDRQQAQLEASDEFALAVAPGLLRGDLGDRRVVLVSTPETPADVAERMTPLLEQAGARVTGTLTLLPALTAGGSRQLVEDIFAQVLPPGVELPDTEPADRAAALLAAALVKPGDKPGLEPADAQAVVSAFSEADLIQFAGAGDTLEPATLALVLTGPSSTQDLKDEQEAEQQEQRAAVLALAEALDRLADGAVLAGPAGSAEDRGTVRDLRDDAGLAGRVSTVDNADRGTGQVAVVLALAQQLTGASGQYGAGRGATAPLPENAAS